MCVYELLNTLKFCLIWIQYVKCGFAGENFPTSVFPCVVGRPMLRYEESLMEQDLKVGFFPPRAFVFVYTFVSLFMKITSVFRSHI